MFPPLDGQPVERRVRREVVLETTVGEVRIGDWYGRRASDGTWVYPVKEVWKLEARETHGRPMEPPQRDRSFVDVDLAAAPPALAGD